jgi:hypothetical protein
MTDRSLPRLLMLATGGLAIIVISRAAFGAAQHSERPRSTTSNAISSCAAGRPATTLRLTTSLHRPELIPRCIVAAAGQRLTLIFHDNLVGLPANLSILPHASSAFGIVDGQLVTPGDPARALFTGRRSWLPKRVTYRVGALEPGNYVVQGDSYPSLMRAELLVKPVT